jgi:hypothetical protein
VAVAYSAPRTPHFYIFDQERKLAHAYIGGDSPRYTFKMIVNDPERVLEELLADQPASTPMTNPIGCNVKWEGKDTHGMPSY